MAEPNDPLSERELEILRLVATGAANKQIAQQLVISPNTVKVHLRNIFAKTGVSSRTEATLYAMKIGLVQTTPAQDIVAEAPTTQPEAAASAEKQPESDSLAVPPARAWKSWQVALAILAVLTLLAAGAAWLPRIMNPALTAEATAGQEALAVEAGSRWAVNSGLPSPRMGMGAVEYENAFYLIAGQTNRGVDGTVLRYFPEDGTWETLASKPTAVTDVQAALAGEKIYVPGGCLADGSATDVLEVFDPRQNSWERKAPLPGPACAYALVNYEGQLYLFGGKRGSQYLSEVFVYNPYEDSWQERLPMSAPRAYAGAVVANGKILVIGGFDGQQALSLNEAYFPNREIAGEAAWESYAPLPQGRYAMGITQLAGLVFLLGGTGTETAAGDLPALEYLSQSDQWAEFEEAPESPGTSPAVIAFGNFLHTFGGKNLAGISANHQSYQAIYTISVPYLSGNE